MYSLSCSFIAVLTDGWQCKLKDHAHCQNRFASIFIKWVRLEYKNWVTVSAWNHLVRQQWWPCSHTERHRQLWETKRPFYIRIGCSPSSSDITINESVNSRERGSDLGTGLITCNKRLNMNNNLILSIFSLTSCWYQIWSNMCVFIFEWEI